jgi:two-component system sensor histidine kinase KdpD
LIEEADEVAQTAIRVARGRGTTYLLMGTPKPRNAWRRLSQPALPFQLLKGLPGVDLRIVADRTLLPTTGEIAEEEAAAL